MLTEVLGLAMLRMRPPIELLAFSGAVGSVLATATDHELALQLVYLALERLFNQYRTSI
jgi:hypothetical protein